MQRLARGKTNRKCRLVQQRWEGHNRNTAIAPAECKRARMEALGTQQRIDTIFEFFDTDNDGVLQLDELWRMVHQLSIHPQQKQGPPPLMSFFSLVLPALNGKTELDKEQFAKFYAALPDHDIQTDYEATISIRDTPAAPQTLSTLGDVTIESLQIPMSDGHQLAVRVFMPKEPIAVSVFAHGGCFAMGDVDSQPQINEALAAFGVASISSSYRQGHNSPHPAAQSDLSEVALFAQQRWPQLPLGIVGSSSGGWHALKLSRTIPDVKFCVALCPVAHPGRRAVYLRACEEGTVREGGYTVHHPAVRANAMMEMQTSYWQTEAAMHAAGEELLEPHNVPTMMVLGSVDKNVPADVTAGVQCWADRVLVLGSVGHEAQEAPPERDSWVPDVAAFVRKALGLPQTPY